MKKQPNMATGKKYPRRKNVNQQNNLEEEGSLC